MNKTVLYTENNNVEAATITVIDHNNSPYSVQIKEHIYIGRTVSGSNCELQIDSPIVSRNHGEIFIANGKFYYRDLDSTNGTYINNTLYGAETGKTVCELNEGDVISFDIREDDKCHPDSVLCVFSLVGFNYSKANEIALAENIAELKIGRLIEDGLKFENEMISARHASFFNTQNGWAIIDHKSTNGVYLNGKRISSPKYLEVYDVVRIVNTVFIYYGDKIVYAGEGISSNIPVKETVKAPTPVVAKPTEQPVVRSSKISNSPDLVIDIVERSVVQRFKKLMLLQNINISIANGEMVLILGGSGAGKTTFINAVMGYEKAEGKIVYNDTDIYEEYERMKYEIGFVPQQDLLRMSDTVYDTLANAAEMKLPKSISEEKREEKILSVLNRFGLSREKDSLVSKLSGGQKKRLSIAVEFIADPSLFFLDEPDSGIDDVMGRGLMETLREIADLGKIIMVITHSPERAADLFDKVIVLAKSTKDNCGHLAFFGGVRQAFDFFGVSSFREIVKKINRPDENGEGLSDYFIEKYQSLQGGAL